MVVIFVIFAMAGGKLPCLRNVAASAAWVIAFSGYLLEKNLKGADCTVFTAIYQTSKSHVEQPKVGPKREKCQIVHTFKLYNG